MIQRNNYYSRRTLVELIVTFLGLAGFVQSGQAAEGMTTNSNPAPNGSFPNGLVEVRDGSLYGTTYKGGNSDFGTVFKMTSPGCLTTLVSFNRTNGCHPYAALTEGQDGNLYGTTYQGGSSDKGTVFKVTPNGELTTLVSFNGTNGSCPQAALLPGRDGDLFGTTRFGGPAESGTIFKVSPTGQFSTLVSLSHGIFLNALIQDRDGNIYGTSELGGNEDNGTAFKVLPTGELVTLVPFAWSNGCHPYAALVEGQDGNFYGTTKGGGACGDVGTVFKMTPVGALTPLVSLNRINGKSPEAALVQGRDGNFYGTTKAGGKSDCGTVFKMTPAGELSTLVSFSGVNGKYPKAALVESKDGNFYGTTEKGGSANLGTVFKMSAAGELTTLISFNGKAGDVAGKVSQATVPDKRAGLVAADDKTPVTSFRYWDQKDAQGKPITNIEPQRIYGELYYVGTVGFCAYLLNTGNGLLLFDTSVPAEMHLSKRIEKLGFAAKDVKWIFNTHYHGDHVGGNVEIMKQSKAKMYLHVKGMDRLDLGLGKGKIPDNCEVVGLNGGETITCGNYKINVIYTPGHSPDSCCFSVDVPVEHGIKKALAMGDASGFWCDVAWEQRNGYPGAGRDYRKTIPFMKTLGFDFLLPGHPWQIVKETNNDGNPFASREDYCRFLENRFNLADEFLKRHPEYE